MVNYHKSQQYGMIDTQYYTKIKGIDSHFEASISSYGSWFGSPCWYRLLTVPLLRCVLRASGTVYTAIDIATGQEVESPPDSVRLPSATPVCLSYKCPL